MEQKKELSLIAFESAEAWRKWLQENSSNDDGIWMRIYKKSSGIISVSYDGALEEALCYGWIDGQRKKYDEVSYLQKFTPRRPRSVWSKRNIGLVEKLKKEGKMRPSGLEQVKTAKDDGRWESAYDSPNNMTIPDDFLQELAKNKKAHEFFKTLNKSNMYAIGWRLQTAKRPETRERRMKLILEKLAKGETFH